MGARHWEMESWAADGAGPAFLDKTSVKQALSRDQCSKSQASMQAFCFINLALDTSQNPWAAVSVLLSPARGLTSLATGMRLFDIKWFFISSAGHLLRIPTSPLWISTFGYNINCVGEKTFYLWMKRWAKVHKSQNPQLRMTEVEKQVSSHEYLKGSLYRMSTSGFPSAAATQGWINFKDKNRPSVRERRNFSVLNGD